MNAYVGIDPGKDGAIAVIFSDGRVDFCDTPTVNVGGTKRQYDENEMARIVLDILCICDAQFSLELTHSMPGQGVASMFSMGEGLGLWKGILAALGVRWSLVTPQRWKKALMDGQPKEKSASVIVAKRLFPSVADQLETKRGRALDGRADALLIAEHLRRTSGVGA